ncbi:MAG: hypothetical protein GX638_11815 [Crenarchaeota archaeon]|nr:hypothetical protein [Thermoproteota archaeon]
MADTRLNLHYLLVNVLGSNNVYFQPPSTITMKYPCIVYKRASQNDIYANNSLYTNKKKYLVTIIDSNPDSEIPDRMMQLRYCSFDRHYVADGLNHDVYEIFF